MTNSHLAEGTKPPCLGDLPPAQAHFCLNLEATLKKYLPCLANTHVVLAISGGADSIALGLIMHILGKRLALTLSAFHLNHGLRTNADLDEKFVKNFCLQLQMPCRVVKADIKKFSTQNKVGLEEGGRICRYTFMQEYCREIDAKFIITGHHAADLTEDILMRLARGASWPALGGMKWQSGNILHPLLYEKPERLKEFVAACGYFWREDESNADMKFRRNRIRHKILPLLEKENPALVKNCLNINEQARLDDDYWREEIEKVLKKCPWELYVADAEVHLKLSRRLLAPMHPALRQRFFNFALAWLRKYLSLPGQNAALAIRALEELFQKNTGGKILECQGGIRAKTESGDIHLLAAAKRTL